MITACSYAPSRSCKSQPGLDLTTSTAISVEGTLKDRAHFLTIMCKATESSGKDGTMTVSDRCSK